MSEETDDLEDRIGELEKALAELQQHLADKERDFENRIRQADEALARAIDQLGNERAALNLERDRIDILFRRFAPEADDVESDGTGTLIPLNLTATGGSYGDRDNEPGIIYTVINPADGTTWTSISLTGHGVRVANATMMASGTKGIGYIGDDGVIVLLFADERYAISACEDV